jgi:hypothetical protein
VAAVMIPPVRGAGDRSRNATVITFQPNSLHLRGARHARPLQVEDHLAPRSAAANKRISRCGRIQRLRVIFHGAGNQRRLTGVADPGSTGPPHSHIACFCKFEQAVVFGIPRQRESAAREGNLRSGARRSRRQMRKMRLGFHPRRDGIKCAKYLRVNMISSDTPRR